MRLHELVDAVTADEPPMTRTADGIIAAGRRAVRRRRAGFASAGAAGLVAVVVAGAFVLPTFGSEQQNRTTRGVPAQVGAATGKAPEAKWADAAPYTFTFKGYTAGALHVQDPIVSSTVYQIAPIYSDGHTSDDKPMTEAEPEGQGGNVRERKNRARNAKPSLWAYLTVYRTGAFDPAGVKDGKNVTVAGRNAVQATLPIGLDPKNPVDEGNKLFAWEYADNAWAAVTSISGDPATPSFEDLGGLVEGLKPSTPRAAKLPFTMGYVPSGYVPLQIGEHAMPGLAGVAAARAGDYGGATFTKPAMPTSGLTAPYDSADDAITDGFHIFVSPSTNSNQDAEPGKAKCFSGGFCNVWSADGKVQLQVSAQTAGNKLAKAELEKVAAEITVADVEDESTWTAVAEALK
jgi:hypothetical protein